MWGREEPARPQPRRAPPRRLSRSIQSLLSKSTRVMRVLILSARSGLHCASVFGFLSCDTVFARDCCSLLNRQDLCAPPLRAPQVALRLLASFAGRTERGEGSSAAPASGAASQALSDVFTPAVRAAAKAHLDLLEATRREFTRARVLMVAQRQVLRRPLNLGALAGRRPQQRQPSS